MTIDLVFFAWNIVRLFLRPRTLERWLCACQSHLFFVVDGLSFHLAATIRCLLQPKQVVGLLTASSTPSV